MDGDDFIREKLSGMSDGALLERLGAGAESYRPGAFGLYLEEARRRGLETTGPIGKAAAGGKRQALKKTITDYIYAVVPVFGVLLFITRSVQLILHRYGGKPIEEAGLRHFIRQWRLSIVSFFTTAVLIVLLVLGTLIDISF